PEPAGSRSRASRVGADSATAAASSSGVASQYSNHGVVVAPSHTQDTQLPASPPAAKVPGVVVGLVGAAVAGVHAPADQLWPGRATAARRRQDLGRLRRAAQQAKVGT
ncbi:hypothetical protein, partial [Nonomuraea sp. NPDC049784]|uniref:hypothetical protein n=1 Tax=Nonomuraea sp. NPDC049784 TaxID=3154361 RepID=UPI0033EEB044